jgi:hypothetical protein
MPLQAPKWGRLPLGNAQERQVCVEVADADYKLLTFSVFYRQEVKPHCPEMLPSIVCDVRVLSCFQ